MAEPFIQFRNITKRFAGVTALDDVSLDVPAGECHGLMGENGAGKSTLGKILAGIYRADAGTITLAGDAVSFGSPGDATAAGVGMVHQELAFCPDLTVAENLNMGPIPATVSASLLIARKCESAPASCSPTSRRRSTSRVRCGSFRPRTSRPFRSPPPSGTGARVPRLRRTDQQFVRA